MSCNIFYADDDDDDLGIFIDAVNRISDQVKVTTQGNGDELIRLLKNPPPYPNMIFLDLNMPIKNGYEVLKEIMESDRIKDLPVVIFTTSNHNTAVEITRKLGARLFIPKPSSFDELLTIVKYVLSINWDTFSATDKNFLYTNN